MSEITLVKILLPETLSGHFNVAIRGEAVHGRIRLPDWKRGLQFPMEAIREGVSQSYFDRGGYCRARVSPFAAGTLLIHGATLDPIPNLLSFDHAAFNGSPHVNVGLKINLLSLSQKERKLVIAELRQVIASSAERFDKFRLT